VKPSVGSQGRSGISGGLFVLRKSKPRLKEKPGSHRSTGLLGGWPRGLDYLNPVGHRVKGGLCSSITSAGCAAGTFACSGTAFAVPNSAADSIRAASATLGSVEKTQYYVEDSYWDGYYWCWYEFGWHGLHSIISGLKSYRNIASGTVVVQAGRPCNERGEPKAFKSLLQRVSLV
jgi:hypothetical protein